MTLSVRCLKSYLWLLPLWDGGAALTLPSFRADPTPAGPPAWLVGQTSLTVLFEVFLGSLAPLLSGGADLTHLMQFFGSSLQSMLQRKRSQASQPMGGFRRSPFSRTSTRATKARKSTVGGWTVSGSHSPSPLPTLSACRPALHIRGTRLSSLRWNGLFLQLLAPTRL